MSFQESLTHVKYEQAALAIGEYRAEHTLARAEIALLQRAQDWCNRRSRELKDTAETAKERDHQIRKRAKAIVQPPCETCTKPASIVIDGVHLCTACAQAVA